MTTARLNPGIPLLFNGVTKMGMHEKREWNPNPDLTGPGLQGGKWKEGQMEPHGPPASTPLAQSRRQVA